jgi:uncharacterized spore protein YtfJ
MGNENGEPKRRRLRIETVRGEPIHIQGRSLTPEARIVSFGRARGTIGSQRIGGWATGFAHITPLAVIEETGEGERRIATTDATAMALWGLLGAAMAIVLFFPTIRWLARRARRAAS